MQKTKSVNTRALVESAVLIALGFILSYFKVRTGAHGGSITALSMLPLLLIGLRHGPYWGIGAGVVYGFLQIFQSGGVGVSAAEDFGAFITAFALDYFIAFGVLGLSAFFRGSKNGLIFAAPVCLALRYVCHTLSGVIVWGQWAGDKVDVGSLFAIPTPGVVLYSIVYNGVYMIPEIIFTTIMAVIITRKAYVIISGE